MVNPLGRLVSKLRAVNGLHALAASSARLRDRRRHPRRETGDDGTLVWHQPGGDREVEHVQVHDLSAHGIGVLLLRGLPVGQTVWFEPSDGPVIKGVIRHCEEQDGHFSAGIIRVDTERRRVERQPVRGAGTLDWYGDGGKTCSTSVVVRDASEFGLQLSARDPVPVGRAARLSGETMGCLGTVCYCTEFEGEHLVGIHFSRQPYDQGGADFKSN